MILRRKAVAASQLFRIGMFFFALCKKNVGNVFFNYFIWFFSFFGGAVFFGSRESLKVRSLSFECRFMWTSMYFCEERPTEGSVHNALACSANEERDGFQFFRLTGVAQSPKSFFECRFMWTSMYFCEESPTWESVDNALACSFWRANEERDRFQFFSAHGSRSNSEVFL